MPLLAAAFHTLPSFFRPEIYFQVAVTSGFVQTLEAQQILSRYRRFTWLSALAAMTPLLLVRLVNEPILFGLPGLVAAIGPVIAYRKAQQQTKLAVLTATPVRTVELLPFEQPLPGGWLLIALPYWMFFLIGIYLYLHWDAIPERFPRHWGLDSQPNGWSNKTFLGVYGPLLFDTATISFALWIFRNHWKEFRRKTRPPMKYVMVSFFAVTLFLRSLVAR